jgi:hypothetical protein
MEDMKMIRFRPDFKKDKLLWEDIITIDVNENIPHFKNRENSSHIVRLYERLDGEKYYLFMQPKVNHDYWNRSDEWLEPSSNFMSWGKFITHYNKPHYQSLRKIILFDEETHIFWIYGIDLNTYQESILKEQIFLPLTISL